MEFPKRSLVWRYYNDCRKTDNNTVQCRGCMKKYSHKGNTSNMLKHLRMFHSKMYSELLSEQNNRQNGQKPADSCLPGSSEEEDRAQKDVFDGNQAETSEIDVKSEALTDVYYDESFTAESPSRCEDSLQEPSTSVFAASTTPAVANTSSSNASSFDCSPPKRKRNEVDMSRMITSISSDIRSLLDRSVSASDTHFYHSVAFEIERLDEDSKDLVKAAIWQVLYKVKSAKKKNVDLSLEDVFK